MTSATAALRGPLRKRDSHLWARHAEGSPAPEIEIGATVSLANNYWITLWNVIECKGRIGDRNSLKERFAKYIARLVSAALMRDEDLRREFTISIGMELKKHEKEIAKIFKQPKTK